MTAVGLLSDAIHKGGSYFDRIDSVDRFAVRHSNCGGFLTKHWPHTG